MLFYVPSIRYVNIFTFITYYILVIRGTITFSIFVSSLRSFVAWLTPWTLNLSIQSSKSILQYWWMASKIQRVACFFFFYFCFIFLSSTDVRPYLLNDRFVRILEIDMKKRNFLLMESNPFDRSSFSITEKF